MKKSNPMLAGALFMFAGASFMAASLLASRGVFFILGCAFISIGGALLAQARRSK